jgi:hypothetical protein
VSTLVREVLPDRTGLRSIRRRLASPPRRGQGGNRQRALPAIPLQNISPTLRRRLSPSDAASPRRRRGPCSTASDRPTECRTGGAPRGCQSRALRIPFDPRQHRPGAADQSGAALDQAFGGGLAATEPPAHADEIHHRPDRSVAGRHQHLEGLTQEIVEQCLDRPSRFLKGALVGLGDIDRAGLAELVRRRLVAVLPRLVAIGVVVARRKVGRREGHQERILALGTAALRLNRLAPRLWARTSVQPVPRACLSLGRRWATASSAHFRRESPAAARLAGLDQNGMPLRGARGNTKFGPLS